MSTCYMRHNEKEQERKMQEKGKTKEGKIP